jgi:inorganic pyrophosphatase
MKVTVETPKWSFTKYRAGKGGVEAEFRSPLPNLFTYGFLDGTKAEDGMEEDVIVLEGGFRPGERVEVTEVGVVRFTDDGKKDDKIVASVVGRIGWGDVAKIRVFFTVYAMFKTARGFFAERRLVRCSFGGFSPLSKAR